LTFFRFKSDFESTSANVSAMIQVLDSHEMGGRALRVNEAQDRPRVAVAAVGKLIR